MIDSIYKISVIGQHESEVHVHVDLSKILALQLCEEDGAEFYGSIYIDCQLRDEPVRVQFSKFQADYLTPSENGRDAFVKLLGAWERFKRQ